MKKLLCLLLALMLSLTAVSALAEDLLDTIRTRGYIIVGTEGTYSPNSYYDESGKLVGFDVEVAAAIAAKLGVGIEYYVADWASIIAGMSSGRCDTVINEVERTAERELVYDFSIPYTYIHGALLVSGSNTDINSFDDLNGKRAAQNATSTWGMMAESLGCTIVPVTGDAQTFELIATGRADCSLNAETAFADFMAKHPEVSVRVAARTETASSSVVPAPKGNERFIEAVNQAIEELRLDGTLSELSIRYFGGDFTEN